MTSILFLSTDPIGERMNGPAIRHYELARHLANAGYTCTLMSPSASSDGRAGPVSLRAMNGQADIRREVERHEVILFTPAAIPSGSDDLIRKKWLVADLFVPHYFESGASGPVLDAGQVRSGAGIHHSVHQDFLLHRLERALDLANHIICGSERQRQWILGLLTAFGKIGDGQRRMSAPIEDYVSLVPYGTPADPPASSRSRIKGVIPGICAGDKVILWWGCWCDWYDLETLFSAMEILAKNRPDIKLVMGHPVHPGAEEEPSKSIQASIRQAKDRGLLNRSIFILEEWIPYENRGEYLLQADAGIYCHRKTLESFYSIRSRFFDYIWAGLPVIISEGDAFEYPVRNAALGCVVSQDDARGWADAIVSTCDLSVESKLALWEKMKSFRSRHSWLAAAACLEAALRRGRSVEHSTPSILNYGRYAAHLVQRARQTYRQAGLMPTVSKIKTHVQKWLARP